MRLKMLFIIAILAVLAGFALVVADISPTTIYKHEGIALFDDTELAQLMHDIFEHHVTSETRDTPLSLLSLNTINRAGESLVSFTFYASADLGYGTVTEYKPGTNRYP